MSSPSAQIAKRHLACFKPIKRGPRSNTILFLFPFSCLLINFFPFRYVDTNRMVAVELGASADLKAVIAKTGMKNAVTSSNVAQPGEPNDAMYLKQAEHLMKRSIFSSALMYLNLALAMNPTSKTAQSTRARCLLMMGKWEDASRAADQVLKRDKTFVKALLVKAEALYNTCDFEHALVLFHRGQVVRKPLRK